MTPAPVRLLVQYDGTRFHGWARMEGVPTIQGAMNSAFSTLLRAPVEVTAAGRTDRGVHACGQVVSFLPPRPLDDDAWHRIRRGANALLKPHIVVRDARQAAPGFDARRSAIGKRYVYSIHNAVTPPLFNRHQRWHVHHPLDVEAMRRAAWCLVGEHDFESFRASGCQAAHARRYIWHTDVRRDGDDVVVELRGNAFVRSQVRVVVGTLMEVGLGRRRAEEVRVVMEALDRTRAGRTAPPDGLCLCRVYYREDAADADIPPGASWPGWPSGDKF
jgi:tRNA pseudouridine38-40 synthase